MPQSKPNHLLSLKHCFLVPALSYLPDRLIRWAGGWWPWYDPADGWHIWLDASYHKWVRKDRRS